MTSKIGSGHLNENHTRSLEDVLYVDFMVQELRSKRRPRYDVPTHFNGKPISELTDSERGEFIFSMQPESTKQAILKQRERKPEDDLDFLLRPINPDYLANKEAKTLDDLTAKRALDPQDTDLHRSTQHNRNTLGDSKQGSIDKESRDRGIHAFTYSKPANPSLSDIKRIKKLTEIEAVIPDPVQIEKVEDESITLYSRFIIWLQGKLGV